MWGRERVIFIYILAKKFGYIIIYIDILFVRKFYSDFLLIQNFDSNLTNDKRNYSSRNFTPSDSLLIQKFDSDLTNDPLVQMLV